MADPEIVKFEIWKPSTGQDPAKYLVDPGSVVAPGQHSAGQLRHARPYLVSDQAFFVFPVGVEGFTRSGQATLGLHHYIGGNTVEGVTIHFEEARIELSGTFPGITAQDNMVECINILRSQPASPGLVLYAPGVFEREQYILPESWNFTHDPADRSHSIDYTITLVRIGEGTKVPDKAGTPPPPNPSITKRKPKGKPARIFIVKDNVRTLRAVAKAVYGDQSKWNKIVQLNQGQLASWQRGQGMNVANGLPSYQLPTYRWPIGTKFSY